MPPFISDEALQRELSRYGQLVSAIKKIATTESMKCFGCGKVGHLVRVCPDKNVLNGTEDEGQSVEKESEISEVSDLSVNKEELGSSTGKSSEERVPKNDETMDVEFDEMEGEIFKEDEAVFKVPRVKRKLKMCEMATTSKKKAQDETVDKSSGEVLNASDLSGSESEQEFSEVQIEEDVRQDYSGYSLERMKNFLQRTKGMRNVEVIDFFPDLSLFIESAKSLMKQKGEGCLSNPEVYRLKKIVQKVRPQAMNNDMSQE